MLTFVTQVFANLNKHRPPHDEISCMGLPTIIGLPPSCIYPTSNIRYLISIPRASPHTIVGDLWGLTLRCIGNATGRTKRAVFESPLKSGSYMKLLYVP